MDKKYLEEQMSAYLDGELSPDEMAQYAQEIQAYPELFAELQTMERLNKLAKSAGVVLPDEKYFEDLAARIDESVAKQPSGQSGIVDFLLARRKSVAIISSAAAVLLIVLIGMNMFGPTAKKYPNELPAYKAAPLKVIINNQRVDTAAAGSNVKPMAVPDEDLSEEAKLQEVIVSDEAKSEIDLPVPDSAFAPATVQKNKSEMSKEWRVPSVATSVPPIEEPPPIETTFTLTLHEYQLLPIIEIKKSEPAKPSLPRSSGGVPSVESEAVQLQSGQALSARVEDSVVIFTEIIVPGFNKPLAASTPKSKSTKQASTPSFDTGDASRNLYRTVSYELDEGVYRSWRLSAPSWASDSLHAWKDSLTILGPAHWYAEQAYRSLMANQVTNDDYLLLRAYIDHYTAETQIPDSAVWNRRIPVIDEIYQRKLDRQNRD